LIVAYNFRPVCHVCGLDYNRRDWCQQVTVSCHVKWQTGAGPTNRACLHKPTDRAQVLDGISLRLDVQHTE